MAYTLPKLPYAYDALEPFIDARTMEIHHTKHHQIYVDKLNAALDTVPGLQEKPLEDLLRDLSAVPESIRTAVRNHGGGHLNHSLFWTLMQPNGGKPTGTLAEALTKTFGGVQQFQDEFSKAAVGVFGSGWAWLVKKDGKLAITQTANQDSPISTGATPLLGIDVWEHAYYLKYQQKRADYVAAWWNVVNWDAVTEYFMKAK